MFLLKTDKCTQFRNLQMKPGSLQETQEKGQISNLGRHYNTRLGSLTSCMGPLHTVHEDNWKDCIMTWATPCESKRCTEHWTHTGGGHCKRGWQCLEKKGCQSLQCTTNWVVIMSSSWTWILFNMFHGSICHMLWRKSHHLIAGQPWAIRWEWKQKKVWSRLRLHRK